MHESVTYADFGGKSDGDHGPESVQDASFFFVFFFFFFAFFFLFLSFFLSLLFRLLLFHSFSLLLLSQKFSVYKLEIL